MDWNSQQDTSQEKNKDELRTTTFSWGRLITFSDGSESRQSQQSVLNPNTHKPAGLLSFAIDHLAQEAIVVVVDRHQRGVSERLVEPDLGPAVADVSDFAVENLASCSKYAHNRGLAALVAQILSLIRLLIKRDRRIRDHGLQAHDDMLGVFRQRLLGSPERA